MILRTFCLLCVFTATTGCTHLQLNHSASKQAGSITDLQYRQVLDNLALFQDTPDALPHFAVVGTGGTSVNDRGEVAAELEWNPFTIVREQLGLGVSREVAEQWTLAPVINPDKLRAIRCAFQLVASGTSSDREADSLLKSFLGDGYAEWIRREWYGIGRFKDVPKGACYVGRSGHRCVWVMPDGIDGLSRLTVAVLNIATLDSNPPPVLPTKTVYQYSYKDGRLDSVEVLTRLDPDAPKPASGQSRKDFFNPIQSQIQLQGR
jgi:hypothetical protein